MVLRRFNEKCVGHGRLRIAPSRTPVNFLVRIRRSRLVPAGHCSCGDHFVLRDRRHLKLQGHLGTVEKGD